MSSPFASTAGGYPEGRLPSSPLVRSAEVARLLGISKRTLRRLVLAGDLTPIYLHRYPVYDTEEVVALIARRRRGTR